MMQQLSLVGTLTMCTMPALQNGTIFPPDYTSARARFLQALAQLPAELVQRKAIAHPMRGPDDSPLYCDWVELGQSRQPGKLLVLISGTHGVEGYAGSAIQSWLLDNGIKHWLEDPELGVLMIHALNPWGFAWNRRCDHERIDINRNFINFNHGLPNNPFYSQVQPLLKPDTLDQFIAHCDNPAVSRGQYQFPNGLFYGGQAPCWSRNVLNRQCKSELFAKAESIAVIDLHTGLGPYGYGEVINDHPVATDGFRLAQKWYGNNAMSAELGVSVSAPKTGLLDFFWHRLLGSRGCFVTLEFGTFATKDLLLRLCEESLYHQQCLDLNKPRDPEHPAIQNLREFFCPEDRSWQEMLFFRARQICQLALTGMSALDSPATGSAS